MQGKRNPTVVHLGVLVPHEMRFASEQELNLYALKAKAANRAWIGAYYALEEYALSIGVNLEELDS